MRELNRRRQIERREEDVKTREFLRKKREEEARASGEEGSGKNNTVSVQGIFLIIFFIEGCFYNIIPKLAIKLYKDFCT